MSIEHPVNPIPPVILAILAVIAFVELRFSAGEAGYVGGPMAIGWRPDAFARYAFSPAVLEILWDRRVLELDLLKRFVTYPFIQASFGSAIFAVALLLALGKFVGDIFGGWRTAVIFFASAIGGAVVYGIVLSGTLPLFGLFTPVYGLIGAFTYLMWLRLGHAGENQIAAFRLIFALLAIQLVFGLIFGNNWQWVAELGGFVFGAFAAIVVAPGGFSAFVRRMRQG